MSRVTALRETARGVCVDVDGERWRTLPADVVVRAELRVGRELDRPTLRAVRRELRRAQAVDVAARALSRRDLTRRELAQRLERAAVAPTQRAAVLGTLERAGLVDDARTAAARAETLAQRGYGNEAVRFDLEGRGVAPAEISAAIEGLAPEVERGRALVERGGRTPATARRLAARGFGAETLESLFGADVAEDGGGALQ